MEYSSEALQQAVKLGSELLRLSGSVEKAAGALNRERVALLGNHLSFTEEGHVIGISDLHKAYLIENGPARGSEQKRGRPGPRASSSQPSGASSGPFQASGPFPASQASSGPFLGFWTFSQPFLEQRITVQCGGTKTS